MATKGDGSSLEPDQESFLQGTDDHLGVSLMYGTVTGLTCVSVGYPMDTAKVRLQMGHPVNLGLLAKPYQGVLSPLLAVPPSWSANFLFYGLAIKGLGNNSLYSVMTAGAFAGIGYAVIICPFEMVKCNTQGKKTPLIMTCRQLLNQHGFRILYRGFGACICRDVGQTAAYYWFAERFGRSENLQAWFGDQAPFAAGMLTGLGHCHVEMPFDCCKTRMQTNLAYKCYAELLRELFQDGRATGITRLYKGYTPWMSRAMVCHGSSFYAIAKVKELTGL